MSLGAYAVTTSQHSSAVKLVQREKELVLEHSHEYYELVAVLRGDGEHVVNGTPVSLLAREVFLIPPGARHYYRDFSRIVLLEFLFLPDLLTPYLPELKKISAFESILLNAGNPETGNFVSEEVMYRLDELNFRIKEEQLEFLPGFVPLQDLLTMEALFLTVRHAVESRRSTVGASRHFSSVLSYLEKNYSRKITLEHLAQLSDMSIPTFCRNFKRTFEKSPIRFLLELRIARARELLETTHLTLKEVAERTGFMDTNYFSKQFSQINGFPPGKYRKDDHGIIHCPIRTPENAVQLTQFDFLK